MKFKSCLPNPSFFPISPLSPTPTLNTFWLTSSWRSSHKTRQGTATNKRRWPGFLEEHSHLGPSILFPLLKEIQMSFQRYFWGFNANPRKTSTKQANEQHQTEKLLHSEGNHPQNKKVIHWMGGDICKSLIPQEVNTKVRKDLIKSSTKKAWFWNGQRIWIDTSQREHTDPQQDSHHLFLLERCKSKQLRDIVSHLWGWPLSKRQETASAGEDWTDMLLVGM